MMQTLMSDQLYNENSLSDMESPQCDKVFVPDFMLNKHSKPKTSKILNLNHAQQQSNFI